VCIHVLSGVIRASFDRQPHLCVFVCVCVCVRERESMCAFTSVRRASLDKRSKVEDASLLNRGSRCKRARA